MFYFFEIEDQIISPEASSATYCRRLGGLQVRKSQAGQITVLPSESTEPINDRCQSVTD
jgi:hypothetical protein